MGDIYDTIRQGQEPEKQPSNTDRLRELVAELRAEVDEPPAYKVDRPLNEVDEATGLLWLGLQYQRGVYETRLSVADRIEAALTAAPAMDGSNPKQTAAQNYANGYRQGVGDTQNATRKPAISQPTDALRELLAELVKQLRVPMPEIPLPPTAALKAVNNSRRSIAGVIEAALGNSEQQRCDSWYRSTTSDRKLPCDPVWLPLDSDYECGNHAGGKFLSPESEEA